MRFVVVEESTNKDGSMSLLCDYDDEFVAVIRNHYGLKRVSKKRIEQFVIESIEAFFDRLDQEQKENKNGN